jgi:hypothetical protein
MEHKHKHGQSLPGPDGPQSVWQSLHQQEERGMEMKLTTDQLCAMARYRERENVWGQWIAALACVGFGAVFVYGAINAQQIWVRLGHAWMGLLTAVTLWGGRGGARRVQAGESCAQFMVREFEGSRRTLLGIRQGIVLVLPALLLFGWGGHDALLRSAQHLDPASWRYHLMTSPWRIVPVLLVLLAGWVGLGVEAKKRARQAEELRQAKNDSFRQ